MASGVPGDEIHYFNTAKCDHLGKRWDCTASQCPQCELEVLRRHVEELQRSLYTLGREIQLVADRARISEIRSRGGWGIGALSEGSDGPASVLR